MAVYLIENEKTGVKNLVEARTGASALNHVLKKDTKVTTLSTGEMAKLIRQGMTLEAVAEDAKEPKDNGPTPIETAIYKEKETSVSGDDKASDPKKEETKEEVKDENMKAAHDKHEPKKSGLNLSALQRKKA